MATVRESQRASPRNVLVAGAVFLVTGCAVSGGVPPRSVDVPCPQDAGSVVDRVCREDGAVQTLQARFRASVEIAGETQTSDGVLLVRRPDAVRIKLFGLGGMTVHDAVWVGDTTAVRGYIQRPLTAEPLAIELRMGEGVAEPEAQLSLALWALWRPRCGSTPTSLSSEPGWLRLDPDSAHAMARDVRVGPLGVREERLVRAGASGADEILVTYADRDCSIPGVLPTTIVMTSRTDGWRATIQILSQEVNLSLDDALFALPRAAGQVP